VDTEYGGELRAMKGTIIMNSLKVVVFFSFALCLVSSRAGAQPTPEDYDKWCKQEETKFGARFHLPAGIDKSQLGKLQAIVIFHMSKEGRVTKIKPVRKSAAYKAVITIPEKQFISIEKEMMAVVTKTAPLTPIPKSFPGDGEGVSYTYEPNSDKPTKVLLWAEKI
jgi:hypothetical protein